MNTIDIIHQYLFIYNLISHLSLAVAFQYLHRQKINLFNAIYSVGHFWISMAQMSLFTSSFQPGMSPFVSAFGVLGHSSLITYCLKQISTSGPSFWDAWFLLGQCGMIYFYLYNQAENDTMQIPITMEQFTNRRVFLITFYILFIYYLRKVLTTHNITTIPLLLVTSVYFSFIYNYT